MNNTLHLLNRHLHLFFKRPSSLFLAIVSASVVLSLYFLFIKDFMIIALNDKQITTYSEQIVDCIMCAGLLIVVNTTSILSILSLYIQDKVKGVIKDFYISPTSNISIVLSYVFAAILTSFFISLICICFIQFYFYKHYSFIITSAHYIFIFFILLLSSIFASLTLFLIACFIDSYSAYTSIANLFSVVVGFINAVYIPIGMYPNVIQNILNYSPLTKLTACIRYFYTQAIFEKCSTIYPQEAIDFLYVHFGIYDTISIHVYFNIIFICFLLFILLLICNSLYKK